MCGSQKRVTLQLIVNSMETFTGGQLRPISNSSGTSCKDIYYIGETCGSHVSILVFIICRIRFVKVWVGARGYECALGAF